MKGAISLGRLFGINILMHWSFFLILVYIAYRSYAIGLRGMDIAKEVLFVFAVFTCVVLHELGHALAARGYGIATKRILLLPIGGVAQLERMPEKPSQELWVAIAGPLVNVGIALLLLPFAYFFVPANWLENTEVIIDNFLLRLILINIMLIVFNLIPAFPMDGGRILRALLAFRFNYTTSTVIAARIGQAVAIAFIVLGFMYNLFWILIGAFVIMGAEAEVRMVKFRNARKDLKVGDILIDDVPMLQPYHTIREAIKMILNGSGTNFLVVNNNLVEGVITKDILSRAIANEGNDAEVSSVMLTDFPVLTTSQPLEDALKAMEIYKLPLIPVMENGKFVGAIDVDHIIAMLAGKEKPKKKDKI